MNIKFFKMIEFQQVFICIGSYNCGIFYWKILGHLSSLVCSTIWGFTSNVTCKQVWNLASWITLTSFLDLLYRWSINWILNLSICLFLVYRGLLLELQLYRLRFSLQYITSTTVLQRLIFGQRIQHVPKLWSPQDAVLLIPG